MTRLLLTGRLELPRACRETALSRHASSAGFEDPKKGAHGGNMVSPVAKLAGIERLMNAAAEAL